MISFRCGKDLIAHHVWPVEVVRLDAPSLWLVPYEQLHSPLRSYGILLDRRQEHHVLPQPVIAVGFSGDLGLRH